MKQKYETYGNLFSVNVEFLFFSFSSSSSSSFSSFSSSSSSSSSSSLGPVSVLPRMHRSLRLIVQP
jgi:hypothetical protein